ncbi:MAG: alpha/beta fold hydrolase [Lachnospiraceae bacterium]|nr:alpha/beta fold hydrolase [Lachnospiraceae bacterium]
MACKKTDYRHVSRTDGLELCVTRTEPDDASEIIGSAVIVHGMCEHKGRYDETVAFLSEHGYVTVIFDLRGHGGSVRTPEDLGYLYDAGYNGFIEDLKEITDETKAYTAERAGKNVPCVLLAHSMGTLITRCFLRKYDDMVDRVCLFGCPSKRGGMLPGLLIAKTIALFKGGKGHSRLVDFLVGGAFEKPFRKEGRPFAWTNSDPEQVRMYLDDPLCGFRFTLNGHINLIGMTMLTYKDGGYAMKNPALPIRFFSGQDDPCAVSEKKLSDAVRLLKKQGYSDTKGKMYPGMRHEILRERCKETVREDVLRFLTGQEGETEWNVM